MIKASKKFVNILCCMLSVAAFASVKAQERTGTTPQNFPAADPRRTSATVTTTTTAQSQETRGSATQTVTPNTGMARRGSRTRMGRRNTPSSRARAIPVAQRSSAPSVAYMNEPAQPEYLFGQAQVTVRGNEDPIIRLGIAQHGPTVVEFPAADNFYAVHPGGSFLITYDQSPSLANDHYLVFRAGRDFNVPPPDARRPLEPIASVSVQMQSGMFVTFVFYPVRDVARMAHRCVVMYSRDEIVAARRAAGLAVNLDGRSEPAAPPSASSLRVGNANGTGNAPTNAEAMQPPAPEQTATRLVLASGDATNSANERRKKSNRTPNFAKEAQRAIRSALAAPQRFTEWSEANHGLTVSALAPVEIDNRYRMTVIAVKNTTSNGLRLVAGQPDLDIETIDSSSRPVQIQQVTKLHTESSSLSDAIPAGAIAYYAIVYEMPTLGVQQRLRLSVAQIEAADAPASTGLTSAAR